MSHLKWVATFAEVDSIGSWRLDSDRHHSNDGFETVRGVNKLVFNVAIASFDLFTL